MLGKVSVIVEAAMAQFESDMGRAARVSEKEFKKMQRDGERAMRELRKEAVAAGKVLGTVLAAGFIATGFAIRDMMKDAEQIRRLSELSGLGAEQFQKLAAGARTVGIENDKLADIYKDMQDRVGDFIQSGGGPMLDFFEQIAPKVGVTIEQFRRLSGPDALQLFSDSLEKANLSQNEMKFYMEAIASDSSLLIPLLRNGGEGFKFWGEEAQKAGAIMSGETLDATRDLQIEMERVRLSVEGMWRQALPGLLPKLKELALLINSSDFREGFQTLINGAVGAIGAMAKLAVTTANVTKFLAESAAAAINGPSADDIARVEGRIQRITRAMDALRSGSFNPIQMSGELAGIGLPSGKALQLNADLLLGDTGSIIASLNGELAKEQNKLQFGMKLADDAAVQAAKLAEEAAKAITVNAPTVAFGSTGALANPDADRSAAAANKAMAAAEKEAAEAARDFTESQASALRSIEDMRAELAGPAAQAVLNYARVERELDMQVAAGILTWEQYAEAMELVAQQREGDLKRIAEESEKALDGMTAHADQAARNMQDAFAAFLFDPFDGGVKGMLKSFGDTLRQMAAQAAASQIFKAIGTWASSYTGQGAGFINAFGSAMTSSGGRAIGGPVNAGSMYEVGEGGRPELLQSHDGRTYLIPGSDGTVIPASSASAPAAPGGGGVTVQVINNGGGEARTERSRDSNGGDIIKVIIDQAVSKVNEGILKQGGSTGKAMQQAFGLQRRGVPVSG